MAPGFRWFFDQDRNPRWTFLQRSTRSVPRERPTPVHADFIVRVDDILRAKLVTKNFGPVLRDRYREVLSLVGPISVTNPQHVRARARHFQIPIDRRSGFVSTRRRGVPFTLTALRPFSRNTWSVDPPAGSFCAGKLSVGRIEQ